MFFHHSFRAMTGIALSLALFSACTGQGTTPDNNPAGVTPLPPVSKDARVSVNEDEFVSGQLHVSSDNPSPVIFEVVTKPAHGKLTLNSAGAYKYTPSPNFNGKDRFGYRAGDGTVWSGTAIVTLTVRPVNDAPTITGVTLSGQPFVNGAPITAVPSGWSDVEGDAAGYRYRWIINGIVAPETGAVLPGSYVYKGSTIQARVTPFDGVAAGPEISSESVLVGNTAPVSVADTLSLNENATASKAFLASDVDGDALTYEIVTSPMNGAVTLPTAASYVYTPREDWFGTDSFSYRVSDGTAWSNVATVQAAVSLFGPTPYGISNIPGPLSDLACASGGAFSITAITPAPSVQLVAGNPVTFTAVVQYATASADTLRLSMFNSESTVSAPSGEAVAVGPSAGCAETTLTFSNVMIPSDGQSVFVLVTSANKGDIKGSGVMFRTNTPSMSLAALNQPVTQPVVLDADGTATLTLKFSWANVPTDSIWSGFVQMKDDYRYFPMPVSTGNRTLSLVVRPSDCGDGIINVYGSASATDDYSASNLESWLQLFVQIPALMSSYNSAAIQTSPAVINRSVTVRNCSSRTQYVSVSSTDSWIYPAAASTAIAPASSAAVTFATSSAALATGLYQGHVSIAPAEATANTLVLPFQLTVPSAKPYAANVTAYNWYAGTAAAVQLSQVGDDEEVYPITLPFAFSIYGIPLTQASVLTNGYVSFDSQVYSDYSARPIPATVLPLSIAAQWSDMLVRSADQTISTETVGAAPDRRFVITWSNVGSYDSTTATQSAQIIFYEGQDGFLVQNALTETGAAYGINLGNGVVGTAWTPSDGSAFWVAPNWAPVAADLSPAVDEDGLLTSGLTATDSDTADTLTPSIVGQPSHGVVTLTGGLGFTYAPDSNWNGTDSFTYSVSDGQVISNTATVTVTVNAVNDAPSISAATLLLAPYQAGATAFVAASGWFDVEGDAEGYTYRWEVNGLPVPATTNPLSGTYLVKNAVIQAFVTPFDGTDSGVEVASDMQTVENTAPIASSLSATTNEDTPVTAAFNMSDADAADTLTVSIISGPSNGTLSFPTANSFTYTPAANSNGTDSFTYRVNDGTADSNTATVTLNVTAVNDAPAFTNLSSSTGCNPGDAFSFTVDASDVDADALTYASSGGTCAWTTFTAATGTVSGTCPVMPDGCSVDVTVDDGSGPVTSRLRIRPNQARYVSPIASGLQDGTSWSDATSSVQAAATALAASGGAVWIKQGTYTSTGTTPLVVLPTNVDLYGSFGGTETQLSDRTVDPSTTILSGDSDLSGTHTAGDAYHVIQAGGTSRIDGLTVAFGNAAGTSTDQYGGGLYSVGGNLTLDQVAATNNYAALRGAGLYFENGVYNVSNTHSYANASNSDGGGVYSRTSSGVFRNMLVETNTSAVQGAGLMLENNSAVTVTESTISNNVSGNHSGAILFNGGAYTLGNVTIKGNASSSQAGAIYSWNTPVTMYACEFTDNTTVGNGGTLALYGGSSFKLYDTTISKGTGGTGGAIYLNGATLSMTRSTLSFNQSTGSGGAFYLYNNSKGMITDSTVTGNKSTTGGGAFLLISSTLLLDTATVSGNSSGSTGGAADISSAGKLTASSSTFDGNVGGSSGGALWVSGSGSSAVFTDSILQNNTAANAGGAFLNAGAVLTGTRITVQQNVATSNGGAFSISGANSKVTLNDNTLLSGNSAVNGGAVYMASGGTFDATSTEFQINHVTGAGGGLYITGTNATATLTDTLFNGNYAGTTGGKFGGAIYADSNATLIAGTSTFSGNSAYAGGAVYLNGSATQGIFADLIFKNNIGIGLGGGLALNSARATVRNTSFTANTAPNGGGLSLASSAYGYVTSSTFQGNSVTGNGGASYVSVSALTITGSTLKGNTAATSGGAVGQSGGTVTLYNTSVTGNTATTYGGALWGNSSPKLTVIRSKVTANTSGSEGGAIKTDGATLLVVDSLIAWNKAGWYGAGIRMWSGASGVVTNTTFAYNKATVTASHGVISYSAGTMSLTNSILLSNSAANFHTSGGTLSANYNCSDAAITGTGNVTDTLTALDYAASADLFLNQTSPCINGGSATEADSGYALASLDWRNLTTDISTAVLESAGTIAVDPGAHYDPAAAWIQTFAASAGAVNWVTSPGAAQCTLSNSADGLSELISGADLPVGNRAITQPAGTTMTLTCDNTYPQLAAVAQVVAQ